MDELKHAYERLGLPEGASREEVEKRFDLLVRQNRSKKRSGEGEESSFEEILHAYRAIVNQEDQQIIQKMSQDRYSKWGKMAGTAERIDDFFRLYKFRVLAGLIAVAVVVTGIITYVNYRDKQAELAKLPPVDLSLMIVGNFGFQDENDGNAVMEQALLKQFPDWKRFTTKLTYQPPAMKSDSGETQADMAMRQKAMLEVMTETPDIYIMDKDTFKWLGEGGVLEPLDQIVNSDLKGLATEDKQLQAKTQEDQAPHVYAMDISSNPLLKDWPLNKNEVIVGIRAQSEHKDKAIAFIKRYLENK